MIYCADYEGQAIKAPLVRELVNRLNCLFSRGYTCHEVDKLCAAGTTRDGISFYFEKDGKPFKAATVPAAMRTPQGL